MASVSALHGVIPANLMAFDDALEIDEPELRRHVRGLLATDGVTGITTNGHAAEIATLTLDEQRRSLAITLEEAAGSVPVICGVYEDGTAKACRIARMAAQEGADALLVFPSLVWGMGGALRPEMAYRHIAAIADTTDVPLVVFVYPAATGLAIETDNLVRICSEIKMVAAVKEWSNDIATYERNYRALRTLDRHVAILTSFSTALLASLVIGADGILSGHGSLVADLHVALFDAVTRGDLGSARAVAERLYPLTAACYAEPFLDMHNRMKVANVMLGRMRAAHVRPPLQPLSRSEHERIRHALVAADLLDSRHSRVPSGTVLGS